MISLCDGDVRALVQALRDGGMLPPDVDAELRLGSSVSAACDSEGPVLSRWRIWGLYANGRKLLVVRARVRRDYARVDVDEAERPVHWEPGM